MSCRDCEHPGCSGSTCARDGCARRCGCQSGYCCRACEAEDEAERANRKAWNDECANGEAWVDECARVEALVDRVADDDVWHACEPDEGEGTYRVWLVSLHHGVRVRLVVDDLATVTDGKCETTVTVLALTEGDVPQHGPWLDDVPVVDDARLEQLPKRKRYMLA